MADFCRQCSEQHFGQDFKELANLMSEEDAAKGFAASALCEGCGAIQVNQNGECISPDCDCPGHAVAHAWPKSEE
jgi:hypothetical protein